MGFGVQDRLVIGVTGDWPGLGRVAGQSAPKDLRPFCSPRDSAPPYDNLFMVRAQRQRRWRLRVRFLCKLAPMSGAPPAEDCSLIASGPSSTIGPWAPER